MSSVPAIGIKKMRRPLRLEAGAETKRRRTVGLARDRRAKNPGAQAGSVL
jgi:hypothetical protein